MPVWPTGTAWSRWPNGSWPASAPAGATGCRQSARPAASGGQRTGRRWSDQAGRSKVGTATGCGAALTSSNPCSVWLRTPARVTERKRTSVAVRRQNSRIDQPARSAKLGYGSNRDRNPAVGSYRLALLRWTGDPPRSRSSIRATWRASGSSRFPPEPPLGQSGPVRTARARCRGGDSRPWSARPRATKPLGSVGITRPRLQLVAAGPMSLPATGSPGDQAPGR